MKDVEFNPVRLGTYLTVGFAVIIAILAISPDCAGETCTIKAISFYLSSPNEVGDTLAGIASALAFLWIIITVLLQREELREQRKELAAQRQELRLNRIESEKTANALATQVFDNSFFGMLETLNVIIADIDIGKENEATGRDAFQKVKSYLGYWAGMMEKPVPTTALEIREQYGNTFKQYASDLSHYFRFLFRMFRILEDNRKVGSYHAKLLRAQLSDGELYVLFYNCFMDGGENFKRIAETFSLFDNLQLDQLKSKQHCLLFDEQAFGDNPQFKAWVEGQKTL